MNGLDAELEAVSPRHVRRLIAIGKELQAAWERQLRAALPESASAQLLRGQLTRIRAELAVLTARAARQVTDETRAIGEAAAKVARSNLGRQLDAWVERHPSIHVTRGRLAEAAAVLDRGLLERYKVVGAGWARDTIRDMRFHLGAGVRAGETASELAARLAENVGMQPWRALRIVRTEMSYAANRSKLAEFKRAIGADVDRWQKQLIATIDSRTGDDSIYVNGQTRGVNDPFEDNYGRVYQHPPNRPNDREVMVFRPI